jgi:hypothetical protein
MKMDDEKGQPVLLPIYGMGLASRLSSIKKKGQPHLLIKVIADPSSVRVRMSGAF